MSFRKLVHDLSHQPGFVVVVAVLLMAAMGLNASVAYMQLHFKKHPVPPARELYLIADRLGPWQQVSVDQPLPKEVEEVLGTRRYVFREYVDERIVGMELIEQLSGVSAADSDERRRLLSQVQASYPDGVISMAVTYYTGLVDTVAHIPDRCYIADGYRPSHYESATWLLQVVPPRAVNVRFMNFEDQRAGQPRLPRNVAYFFHVNGRYESNPLRVRWALQNLMERYGYYAKIEMMTLLPDQEISAGIMADFLSHALPEIERSWPEMRS